MAPESSGDYQGGPSRALGRARAFTSTTTPVAVAAQKKIPGTGQRNQATASAAPQVRPVPSPAFNRERQKIKAMCSLLSTRAGLIWMNLGYPGGAILPVFDAIYNSKYFDFVLPS
ncbi:hypothetical protein Trco_000102 [Trichoderma cornu-damae]|uniref:Uncharacterized protein n=1 Tax=Trichoderma cornu-damae TaxID=654480 RepID=A0A9P8QWP8_9HYPO|nr:hypothetical protein Trco_000102 [Trichoderma cornu-damae]